MHQGTLSGSSNAILSNKVARTQLRHRNSQRVSQRIQAQAEPEDPTAAVPSQIKSESNGVGNGVSKGLISSNNGVVLDRKGGSLEDRIASGEFGKSKLTKERALRPVRRALAKDPIGPGVNVLAQVLLQDNITWLTIRARTVVQSSHNNCLYRIYNGLIHPASITDHISISMVIRRFAGRKVSLWLAQLGRQWQREANARMPSASGDVREIVGQPVFVPLYKLFITYGPIFRLNFGPKSFVVISDPALAKQVLLTNATKYSKGLLSEILDFVMGQGLIPADGEIWKTRRRAIVPALHKKYIASMVAMFGDSTLHGMQTLEKAVLEDRPVEMENFFSRLTLDIIGKAVFNYDFDSLTNDDPFIQV